MIKLKLSNFNGENMEIPYLISLIDQEVELVKDNEDIIFESLTSFIPLKKKKKILFAYENLFIKYNIISIINVIERKFKLNLNIFKNIFYSYRLDIKIYPIYSNCLKFITNQIGTKDFENYFAVVSNKITGKNILNIPYFMIFNYHNKLLHTEKINNSKNKFCAIIISNDTAIDRIHFFRKLSKYKKVDCFGRTHFTNADNSKLPNLWTTNYKFLTEYKFVICFENSFNDDYITEKLPNVMLANTVPIYKGAPNISHYFNTNSFINYDDFKSYDKMMEKIIELDNDDLKYQTFLNQSWFTTKNIELIKQKENELKDFIKKVVNS